MLLARHSGPSELAQALCATFSPLLHLTLDPRPVPLYSRCTRLLPRPQTESIYVSTLPHLPLLMHFLSLKMKPYPCPAPYLGKILLNWQGPAKRYHLCDAWPNPITRINCTLLRVSVGNLTYVRCVRGCLHYSVFCSLGKELSSHFLAQSQPHPFYKCSLNNCCIELV